MKQVQLDFYDCALNTIMKELANIGEVEFYTPNGYPSRRISTIKNVNAYEYYIETRGWTNLPAGEFIQLNGHCNFLLHVNGVYYFMD